MEKGRIIFLNGVTSAGKTSIVEAIQDRDDVFFHVVANDLFQEMVGEKFLQENYPPQVYNDVKFTAQYENIKKACEITDKTFEYITLPTLKVSSSFIIILCIILVLLQFIVPIKTDSYIKALFTLVLYISISVMFINLNLRKKKRG